MTFYTAIGLMSGTSLDGVDASIIKTDGEVTIDFGQSLTLPYPASFREELKKYLGQKEVPDEITRKLTMYHVAAVNALLDKTGFSYRDIDLVGFHGQTTYHNPDEKCTIQIGDPDLLAKEVQTDVIFDLRQEDIRHGGQGAPLVPIFLAAVANKLGTQLPIAFLNLGGVSNVTYVDTDSLIAFDMGPGNALMDDFLQSRTGETYDKDGALAQKGDIDLRLIRHFIGNDYFDLKPPKSLDRNHFHDILDECKDLSTEDGLASLTEMTVEAIVNGCRFLPDAPKLWVLCGGGRKNKTLHKFMQGRFDNTILAEDIGLDGDALEAQAFAYLAVRSLLTKPITFPSTTNVDRSRCGGELHPWNAS